MKNHLMFRETLLKCKEAFQAGYFIAHMNVLNAEGRFDAHETIPDENEISAVDYSASYLRKALEKYEASLE